MKTKKVYHELADMLVTAPTGAPEMKTPEFLDYLRLLYTPTEARLAIRVGLVGHKLEELSKKTGVEKRRLKQVLQTMADKGTMWIDPREEDPTYRALGMAGPGIEGNPFFAGLKNADTVPMAKLKNKWKYQWIRYGMGSIGFPVAPIWPCEAALPDDALPSENVIELIKQNDYWAVSQCSCRFCHWVDDPGHHCRHLLETCLHMGDIGRYLVEHAMAREITCDDAIEILRKAHEDGLITTCYPERVLCNCCRDCCLFFIGQNEMNITLLQRSNFIAQIDEEACNACKTCAQRCPVGAIEVDESASVDPDLCLGCGLCILKCKTQSVKLVRRPEAVEVTEVGQTAGGAARDGRTTLGTERSGVWHSRSKIEAA